MAQASTAEDVRTFWFAGAESDPQAAQARGAVWFGTSAELDSEVRQRFEPTLLAAARGELAAWERSPCACTALVIVLDQFPRNIYRKTARAFELDPLALGVARRGLAAGYLAVLSIPERTFLLMPYQHSEELAMQQEGVALFERMHREVPAEWRAFTENTLGFARRHLSVIERFGRFPYRNEALGRASTPEERAYLESNPETFGQGR